MTEITDITYSELLRQERLRLLNAGCFNINHVNRRYGVVSVGEQVTSVELTESVLTIKMASRTFVIDDFQSLETDATNPRRLGEAAFTVFAAGPRGGPSPAMSFAPREDAASQALIAQSCELLNTRWQADRQRGSDAKKQELITMLQNALVGREPVSVQLHDDGDRDETGFVLVYNDGSTVAITLHALDIEYSVLEVNGTQVAPTI